MTTLVLPEADPRVLEATQRIASEDIAEVFNISNLTEEQRTLLQETLVSIPRYADASEDEVAEILANNLFVGGLCVRAGLADGMIAGAAHATADVIRVALKIIGVTEGTSTASSCFLMKTKTHGDLVFADCAVNPNPDADALVEIARDSTVTATSLGLTPRVALLSASTHGSARYDNAAKVAEATKKLQETAEDLIVEGEVQLDVALAPEVAKQKGVDAFSETHANVLVFPDLDSGNIGYKLVERLAGAQAIGPILQGFNQPINDLSRGCSVDDIVELAKITVQQCK